MSPPWMPTENISIHAAREGGDIIQHTAAREGLAFQSTPPVKAATASAAQLELERIISIHAAREGGDAPRLCNSAKKLYFNPRRP